MDKNHFDKCVLTFFFADQDSISGTLLSEGCLVGSESALGSSHSGTASLMRMCTSFQIEFAREIRASWLRGRVQTKG